MQHVTGVVIDLNIKWLHLLASLVLVEAEMRVELHKPLIDNGAKRHGALDYVDARR